MLTFLLAILCLNMEGGGTAESGGEADWVGATVVPDPGIGRGSLAEIRQGGGGSTFGFGW